jgi:hypothetical protein
MKGQRFDESLRVDDLPPIGPFPKMPLKERDAWLKRGRQEIDRHKRSAKIAGRKR